MFRDVSKTFCNGYMTNRFFAMSPSAGYNLVVMMMVEVMMRMRVVMVMKRKTTTIDQVGESPRGFWPNRQQEENLQKCSWGAQVFFALKLVWGAQVSFGF